MSAGLDTTQVRVRRILRDMAVEAYGGPASPAVYLCACGHPDSAHEGEEWEGRCLHEDGCECAAYDGD